MSQQGVDKLKALLFEREARDLDALSHRVGSLNERVGDDARLQQSIARVIDGALRDAEVERHRELAAAVAPVVVRTLRTELAAPETQDQLANTLYPRIGDMIRRYVTSVMRDLMEEINRRLESGLTQNRAVLKLRSIATGRPMSELALADAQRLQVDELYLIRRNSGTLVQVWTRGSDAGGGLPGGQSGNNRDALIGGFLTAITSFAEEAFATEGAALRSLELERHTIYLRASSSHLLAARCNGAARADVARVLDEELIKVLEVHRAVEADVAGGRLDAAQSSARHARVLGELALGLESAISEREAELRASQRKSGPIKGLLWLGGVTVVAAVGWQVYVGHVTRKLQERADRAVAALPDLAGYPLKAHAERGARALFVTGLAPSDGARSQLLHALAAIAPDVSIRETIGILPSSDASADIRRAELRRAIDRTVARLELSRRELDVLANSLAGRDDAPRVAAAGAAVDQARAAVQAARDDTASMRSLDAAAAALLAAAADLSGAEVAAAGQRASTVPSSRTADAAEAIALASDLLTQKALAMEQRIALSPFEARIESIARQIDRMPAAMVPLANRLDALDRRIDQLPSPDPLASKLDELERRMSRLPTVELLDRRLGEIESRMESRRPVPTTPRQVLEGFVREHAIFFGDGTALRAPADAAQVLDRLAALVKSASVLLRVVGYTDELGTTTRNSELALARAELIAVELVGRGVARRQLVVLSRTSGNEISANRGNTSTNRRVAFEVGFAGEGSSTP